MLLMKRCSVLPVKTQDCFQISMEADVCTMVILHCLDIRISLPGASTIIVTIRSPDTDVLVLLAPYCKELHMAVLFNTGVGNNRRRLNVNSIGQNMGEGKEICTVLSVIHCFTCRDTTSDFCVTEMSLLLH